jgi:glycosyltransferase involved in cell wall biosynthesis
LSIYEGFFSGGARILHSDVITGLSRRNQEHSVLSLQQHVRRETVSQRMEDDASYRRLVAAGLSVASLGRGPDAPPVLGDVELAMAARYLGRSDVVLALKEQPLRLFDHAEIPWRPVIACLHRSDPQNQGAALESLRRAVESGRIAAVICCADSAKAAYAVAGIPSDVLCVIPNGVDLRRFRPSEHLRARTRRELGIPAAAPVIAFAARYDRMKDVPLFVRAAHAYLLREPAAHVLMCGAGMSTANAGLHADLTAAFAETPWLLERVHRLGVRTDMRAVYPAADVVALTSAYGEAAPLCLIEGMMCGAVPVTTDVGDAAAIVAGLGYVTPADAHVIAATWGEAVERRAELSAALLRSRSRFGRNRMIDSYAAVIRRTVRRNLRTAA